MGVAALARMDLTMRGRRLRLAAALLGSLAVTSPAHAQVGGPVACYVVRDPARHQAFRVTVTTGGVTQSCRLKVPARFGCLGAQLSGITPSPPGGASAGATGDSLCYQLRCPRPFPPAMQRTDEFGGQRVVNFRRGQLLCVPTSDVSTTTTTVPGQSTTTTTLARRSCEFSDGQCVGTCGNGGHCSVVASGGACECRTTACGNADAPSCRGFCARDQFCVFDLTGCRCVTIP
jgi:hypothetical protein